MTKIPLHIAEKLLLLQQGAIISASSAKHAVIDEFVDENIIQRTGRVQKSLSVLNNDRLKVYLQNKFGINVIKMFGGINICNEIKIYGRKIILQY